MCPEYKTTLPGVFENVNDPNKISIEKISEGYLRISQTYNKSKRFPECTNHSAWTVFVREDSRVHFFEDEDGRTYNGIPDNPTEPEINGNSQKCRRRFRLIKKIELSDGIKSFANKRARIQCDVLRHHQAKPQDDGNIEEGGG
ncbi:hypothetical protein V1477_002732 [Vespula maculifrons]|uniref:Uncharacterized protein n=1 Tax=Vespula maculifrons TaxID=7453 RepID=A0ABD2CVL9_VESMC